MTDKEREPQERADTLAGGVFVMLAVTVLQRGIGFARNLVLCRVLDAGELGRWSLAFSFLLLTAPLIVFGLPGTFGRYVESYRRRGQLRDFLRRIGLVCCAATVTATLFMVAAHGRVSYWLFHDDGRTGLVITTAAALFIVTAANFVAELLMALRWARVLSILEFLNSLVFTAVAVGGVLLADAGAAAVLIGFASGAMVTLLGGTWVLLHNAMHFDAADDLVEPQSGIWRTVLPFAGWMWVTNLCANLFDTADRFMLVHLSGLSDADAIVGQYHAGRVVPLMLVSIAGMLSGVVLPHLVADWEAGRSEQLAGRLNRMVEWSLIGFTACGVGILGSSGWLFGWLLGGKYDAGLSILPWTLVYSIWFGTMMLMQNYLWCLEQARAVVSVYIVGIVVNLGLNAWWIPLDGLNGAVWATTLSLAIGVVATQRACARHGFTWSHTNRWLWLLPVSLVAGPLVGAVFVAAALVVLHQRGVIAESLLVLPRWRSREATEGGALSR